MAETAPLIAGRRTRLLICILLFGYLLTGVPGMHGYVSDVAFWARWSGYSREHGLRYVYNSGTDYMPLYQYVLWTFGKLAGSADKITHYIGYIRAFMLAADFWGLYLLYRWIDRRLDYTTLLLLSMLNLGYSYNTVIWCQVDAILAGLLFAALYFQHRGRIILSGVMIVLALNMKLQGVVIVPLWGLLSIEYFARTRSWKKIPLLLGAMILTQGLLILPFTLSNNGLSLLIGKLTGLVDTFPNITVAAMNMWHWLVPPDAVASRDDGLFIAGLTYKQVGLISFCAGSFIAFIPLLTITGRNIFNKNQDRSMPPPPKEIIWLTAMLIALLFFFCNTQMHERYSHPAFIFLAAYAFYTRRYLLYTVFSFAYFLNLEKVLRWFDMPSYDTVIFNGRFVAGPFAIVICGGFYRLYQFHMKSAGDALLYRAITVSSEERSIYSSRMKPGEGHKDAGSAWQERLAAGLFFVF